MTMNTIREDASELLLREARYLDRRLWDEWLELYADDAVFWVPAWKNEEAQTDDPDREVSMIYYEGRIRLSERVWRARSGQSIASTPLHRTMHTVSNVSLERHDDASMDITANWSTHVYDPKTRAQHVFFGFYDYSLVTTRDGLKISRKKVTVLNDHLPIIMDFYSI